MRAPTCEKQTCFHRRVRTCMHAGDLRAKGMLLDRQRCVTAACYLLLNMASTSLQPAACSLHNILILGIFAILGFWEQNIKLMSRVLLKYLVLITWTNTLQKCTTSNWLFVISESSGQCCKRYSTPAFGRTLWTTGVSVHSLKNWNFPCCNRFVASSPTTAPRWEESCLIFIIITHKTHLSKS